MADNSFGIKELNLIGSGTPKIESPNNINLNAVTVAISTNATVGGTLAVTGASTFSGDTKNSSNSAGTYWGAGDELLIKHNGNDSVITNSTDGRLSIQNIVEGQTIEIEPKGNVEINRYGGAMYAEFKDGNSVDLYFSGTKRFETTGAGVSITGICTATSFSGGGNDIVTSQWTLGADGSNHYTFTGPGGLSAATDPTIYLTRGQTYEFVNSSGGSHPFQIRASDGGSAYNTGVTNNGASSGTIKFEVPFAAPNTLVYQCTSHSSMLGNIVVHPSI